MTIGDAIAVSVFLILVFIFYMTAITGRYPWDKEN